MEQRIKALLSFLIVLPENPESDYLHIFNGLYAALFNFFKWHPSTGIYAKTRILSDCFTYICVQMQEKLPYHVENVRSNDSLYTEPEFKQALFEKLQEILNEIDKNLKEINEKKCEDLEVITLFYFFKGIGNCKCDPNKFTGR